MLDTATGKPLSTVATDTPFVLAVDTRLDRVYVGGDATRPQRPEVSMIDARRGRVLATLRVPSPLPVHPSAQPVMMIDSFVCALAVDERAGHVLASLPLGRPFGSASLLDASTGAVLNTVTLGNDPCTDVTDARIGRTFVVNYPDSDIGGYLTVSALDTTSGDLLRTVTIVPGQPGTATVASIAVDEPHNRIFLASQGVTAGTTLPPGMTLSAQLSVLDARTGAILSTVPLTNGMKHAVAVDDRTRRLFVANDGNGTVSVFDLACL